jgi:single-strand DNA-binding protein
MTTMTACGNSTEPELRFTQAGKAVCSFALAIKSKNGEDIATSWLKVEAWEELAENLVNTIAKGDRVLVTGRIKVNEYVTKAGEQKSEMVLVADEAGVSLRWKRERD